MHKIIVIHRQFNAISIKSNSLTELNFPRLRPVIRSGGTVEAAHVVAGDPAEYNTSTTVEMRLSVIDSRSKAM